MQCNGFQIRNRVYGWVVLAFTLILLTDTTLIHFVACSNSINLEVSMEGGESDQEENQENENPENEKEQYFSMNHKELFSLKNQQLFSYYVDVNDWSFHPERFTPPPEI